MPRYSSPAPAMVSVSVLARDGDGTAPDELLAVVAKALNDESVRPVADRVTVASAKIVDYQINAAVCLSDPAVEPIKAAAEHRPKSLYQCAKAPSRP